MFLFIASFFVAIRPEHIFLTAMAAGVQSIASVLSKLNGKLIGLEFVKTKKGLMSRKQNKRVVFLLALTPLVTSLSIVAGGVWILLVSLPLVRPAYEVFSRSSKKASIKEEVSRDLEAYAPEIIVYISGLKNAAYQVNQWIPVLEELDRKVLILAREKRIAYNISDTNIPVMFARTSFDVEACFVKTVKVILYPANPMKNAQALRHYKLKHIFINHGESDKAVNQSKLLMAYDKLFVGGPLAERRLLEAGLPVRPDQVVHVGRPQAEMLLNKIDEPKPIQTILYAPTWEGFVEDVNYCSVNALGLRILEELLVSGKYKILFKPHPYTGTRNSEVKSFLNKMFDLCRLHGGENVSSMVPIYECVNDSDLVITDISSVLNECLVTNKPMIMCNVKGLDENELYEKFPSSRAAYVANDQTQVESLVASISDSDHLWDIRQEVRKDSLGDLQQDALGKFKRSLEELW